MEYVACNLAIKAVPTPRPRCFSGSSSSRVDRSFVKHLGLNWSRCFYYAAALLLLALNQTRSRNIRL
ncbi:hypothetical protein FOS39_06305, partial [Lactobacillus paracasei]|nr:hypothetical protein [Lacticaseibacillus paracasei]